MRSQSSSFFSGLHKKPHGLGNRLSNDRAAPFAGMNDRGAAPRPVLSAETDSSLAGGGGWRSHQPPAPSHRFAQKSDDRPVTECRQPASGAGQLKQPGAAGAAGGGGSGGYDGHVTGRGDDRPEEGRGGGDGSGTEKHTPGASRVAREV